MIWFLLIVLGVWVLWSFNGWVYGPTNTEQKMRKDWLRFQRLSGKDVTNADWDEHLKHYRAEHEKHGIY